MQSNFRVAVSAEPVPPSTPLAAGVVRWAWEEHRVAVGQVAVPDGLDAIYETEGIGDALASIGVRPGLTDDQLRQVVEAVLVALN